MAEPKRQAALPALFLFVVFTWAVDAVAAKMSEGTWLFGILPPWTFGVCTLIIYVNIVILVWNGRMSKP